MFKIFISVSVPVRVEGGQDVRGPSSTDWDPIQASVLQTLNKTTVTGSESETIKI